MSIMPWSRLIDFDAVMELHREAISRFGGDQTPTAKDGCIERSLGAAWNAELYAGSEDALPGLCFAACLLFYLAKNHCFVDGNKRIAWMASMHVLLGLDLTIDVSDDDGEAFCLSILDGTVEHATDVVTWMADKLAAIEED